MLVAALVMSLLSVPASNAAEGNAPAAGAIAARAGAGSCVLIDTDFDVDDMMAIPAVIGSRRVAAVITSEGYTKARPGASALSRLIAEPGQRPIPVIVGADTNRSPASIVKKWGQFVLDYRNLMNRLNDFLPEPLPLAKPKKPNYIKRVEAAVAGCTSVDIEIIGTFTSFVRYSPVIRSKIGKVVIMGKPLRGDKAQAPGLVSFNCAYDLRACKTAFDRQLPGLDYAYVDIPRSSCDATPNSEACAGTVYGPDLAMVEALKSKGLPGALRRVLLNHPSSWAIDGWEQSGNGGISLMWDQSASLYLLDPSIFRKTGGKGGHFVTTLDPAAYRQVWTKYTNRSLTYR